MFLIRFKEIITDSFADISQQPIRILAPLINELKSSTSEISSDVDRQMADFLWAESATSENQSNEARYRIQTPMISTFETEFEKSLLAIKKDLEPLWQDRIAWNVNSDFYGPALYFLILFKEIHKRGVNSVFKNSV